jgi:predicted transposase YbfD/YdcC
MQIGREIQRDCHNAVLLETLDIERCVVSIDTIGTQTKIAGDIINDKKADQVLDLKESQKELQEESESKMR